MCNVGVVRYDRTRTKGLAKLGNIVAETLLRMQMFPSLAARETCVAETNFTARKQEILCPKHMFPSLATPGNIQRNIVSATMFPSLARPLVLVRS